MSWALKQRAVGGGEPLILRTMPPRGAPSRDGAPILSALRQWSSWLVRRNDPETTAGNYDVRIAQAGQEASVTRCTWWIPLCEICTESSHTELRPVEDGEGV